ncbi:MAG: ABC transporter ATP-binding protein [Thermoleophilia bacterium]
MEIVAFHNVSKSYNNGVIALRNVSFTVGNDEIIGLLGRNGAGKTSLINILMGFIRPSLGNVHVVGEAPHKANKHIGYVADLPRFHEKETVLSLLMLLARMQGIERRKQKQTCLELIESVGLTHFMRQKINQLSRGLLQRFNIAQALLGDPNLLVMDEPLSGLDPLAQSETIDLIMRLRRPGRSMFISSHLLFHLEKICDRVLVLDHGVAKFFGKPSSFEEITVVKFFKPLAKQHKRVLQSVGARMIGEAKIEIERPGDDVHQILRYCADNQLEIKSLARNKGSLEELFLDLVKVER